MSKQPPSTFTDRLIEANREKGSVLCVGLDPQLDFIPPHIRTWATKKWGRSVRAIGEAFYRFNREIIDAVVKYAIAVKPQIAFYEGLGHEGLRAYERTVRYARRKGLVVVCDGKRGDGSDTANAYAQGHLGQIPFWSAAKDGLEGVLSWIQGPIRVDALTIHGYIGSDCVTRFVREMKKHGTGAFVVTKTSFKPNSELEQMVTAIDEDSAVVPQNGRPVWQELAGLVAIWSEGTEGLHGWRNLGVVMGATYPEDTPMMRELLPHNYLLKPGYGKQGGGADGAVMGAVNRHGDGILVNSSRGIINAWQDPESPFRCEDRHFARASGRAAKAACNDLDQALVRKFPQAA